MIPAPPARRPRPRLRQRGVAVITALLLTTLAVAIVTSLFWQQQVQVRSMENQRLQLQTKWILRGALEFSIMILRADNAPYTALDQPWATPLAETRLDQYIERERVEGENFTATLSGNITDACARYNLRNLADNGVPDGQQVIIFGRLLQNLNLDKSLALHAADFVAAGQPVSGAVHGATQNQNQNQNQLQGQIGATQLQPQAPPPRGGTNGLPIRLMQVDDLLSVQGFNPAVIERLRPFVVVLPAKTEVNVNTAAAEVLAAVVENNYSVSEANALIVRRKQAPFRGLSDFQTALNNHLPTPGGPGTKSDWFLIDSRIRLDRAALDAESLVHRTSVNGRTDATVEWIRQY
jgi:general secretion pathway protein K